MARLNVDVLVDVKGAAKLDGLAGGLQQTGLKLTKFVTLPLIGLGAASTAMALEAQKSADKLNAAFANMGDKSGKTLAELNAQAEALGQATVFDDEAIREAQAALITFGTVSGEAFDRALEAAAGWAAATGTEAVDATTALGRALSDPVGALGRLSRMGIVFTDQQKEQIKVMTESGDILGAQNLILAEFEQKFGATNAVMQASPAGQTAQAMEDLANAGEDIGAVLLPALAGLARGLSSVALWFTSLDPAAQTMIVTLGGIVAAVGPVVFVAGKLVQSFGAIGTAFNVLKVVMLANPFVALAAAVIAIAALIILNWDSIVSFFKGAIKAIIQAFAKLADSLQGIWRNITRFAGQAWNGLVGIIKGAINLVIKVINGFIGFINGIQIHIPAVGVGPVQTPRFDWNGLNIKKIPYLAEGGLVTEATLAVLGERGPEAVLPLDKLAALQPNVVNVYLTVEGDLTAKTPEEVVEAVQRATRFGFSAQLGQP